MTRFARRAADVDQRVAWAAWLLTAAIFVIDLDHPPGYAIPLLYTLVVLLAMWSPRPRLAIEIAAAATVLTGLDFFLWSEGGDRITGLFNRTLAVAVLWVTAGGLTMYRRSMARERQSLKRLEDTTYALDQAAIVATTDVDGRITFANDKFCEISKYARHELIGRTHRIINSGFHPPEFFAHLWATISAGTVWRGEIRNRAKDGSFYWVDTTIVPFLDGRGRPHQYMAIRYDITERKSSEATLREQASLARLGKMAAIVAHEVRNPLAAMRGALQIVGGRMDAASQERAVIGDVVGRIDALSDIVQDLLLFARPLQPRLAPIPLRALVQETTELLGHDPQFAGVTARIEVPDVVCLADRGQLRIVLLNLLVNSAQAMQGRGQIHASATRTETALTLRIGDEGPGLTSEVVQRMFEPFFTTKHQGTGLGLVTARKILEAHNGTLELENAPHGGAIATVTLPMARA